MAKTAKRGASGDGAQELGRSIITLLLKEPFYGHLLGSVIRRIGNEVPTAAVALTPRGPELIVNPEFFLVELKTQERVAVIKHEALHLVFRHLYRRDGNAELFNIAADLVVNQYVQPWPLPDSAVTLADFPDMDLLPDQTLKWYYDKLSDLHLQMRSGGALSAPNSAQALRRIMGSTSHSDHRFWAAKGGFGFQGSDGNPSGAEVGRTFSEALANALESDLERHLIRARDRISSQQWVNLPAGIRCEIEQAQARRQPQVDWRRTLRLFASSGYQTKVVPTKRRMSKRFNTFPGLRIKGERSVAVVVDTSGSIDESSLAMFFIEIHGLWRTGAGVVILECDAAVQHSYPYRGQTPIAVHGGGGTAFDPAFEWLRNPRNGKFDACIYLTDGCGPAPQIRPPCPLLWVVTTECEIEHLRWGPVTRLQPPHAGMG
jgi:predicted metal-dependent peptidase